MNILSPKNLTITSAEAWEFRLPKSLLRRRGASATRVVIVRVEARRRRRAWVGLGEMVLGKSDAQAWRLAESALDELQDAKLSIRPSTAQHGVADLLERLRRDLRSADPGRRPERIRQILSALEMALLDLTAKAANVPLAEFFGGERRAVHACRELSVGTRNMTWDQVGDLAAGQTLPTWVNRSRPLGPDDAEELVERVLNYADRAQSRLQLLVPTVARTEDRNRLIELQQKTDQVARSTESAPDVVVMADGITVEADARELVSGGVRGLVLNPQLLGGLVSVRDLAVRLRSEYTGLCIGMSVPRYSSGVAIRAAGELVAATPALDYIFLSRHEINESLAVRPALSVASDLWIHPGTGPGAGNALALASAAHLLTRSSRKVVPVRSRSAGKRRPNSYNVGAVEGLAEASYPLERAALSYGLDTVRLSTSRFIGLHSRLDEPIGFSSTTSIWTSGVARRVISDKSWTWRILSDAGLPVPRGAAFSVAEVDRAVDFAASLPGPVVVKPRAGAKGKSVHVGLETEREIREAIKTFSSTKYSGLDFIVEQYVAGNDYRLLVVGNRVVSVVQRYPPFITGDGKSSVVDLVLQQNKVRRQNPHERRHPVAFNEDAQAWLARQGLTPEYVPEAGQYVRLGSAANIANGGYGCEVLDETHPTMLDLAVEATRLIPGLDEAGIDLIGDHRLSVDEQKQLAILELNQPPGTGLHQYPRYGPRRDVCRDLVLRSCQMGGYHPDLSKSDVCLRIVVHGKVQKVGYRDWFAAKARKYDLVGSIRNLPTGEVEAMVYGSVSGVAAVASLAIKGPSRARVRYVTTTHVNDVFPADRFEVMA